MVRKKKSGCWWWGGGGVGGGGKKIQLYNTKVLKEIGFLEKELNLQ